MEETKEQTLLKLRQLELRAEFYGSQGVIRRERIDIDRSFDLTYEDEEVLEWTVENEEGKNLWELNKESVQNTANSQSQIKDKAMEQNEGAGPSKPAQDGGDTEEPPRQVPTSRRGSMGDLDEDFKRMKSS